jgi:hypothetical protein
MKCIICGSRDFKPLEKHILLLDYYCKTYNITEIVSGKQKGADTFGEDYAFENHIPVKPFPAKWTLYGKAAGPIRNKQMAEYADCIILFKGGKGTNNMREYAKMYNLKILYDEEDIDRKLIQTISSKSLDSKASEYIIDNLFNLL